MSKDSGQVATVNIRVGVFHMLVLYIVWGSTYLAMRIAVSGDGPFAPFTMGAMRVLAAGAILLLWAVARRHTLRLTRHSFTILLVSSLLLWVGGNGLVLWAEQYANSGYAALMVGTVPLWTTIFESVLNRRIPSLQLSVALLMGFIGIAFLNAPSLINHASFELYASIALILAPISWALGALLLKRNPVQHSALVSSGYQQIFAGVGFYVVALFLHEAWKTPSPHAWLALGYLIVFGSVIAFTSFGAALSILPSSLVMTYAYVNPVIAIALGWAILHEALNIWNLIGSALILLSVVGVFRANRKPKKPTAMMDVHIRSVPPGEPPSVEV